MLKVTANGTTTSPVKRGVWVMTRLLGQPPPPPPAAVPAVEPDTRGATTIREQLAKHRSMETCNACHRNIDPAGFALESFDVLGAWRDHYRSMGDGPVKGHRPQWATVSLRQGTGGRSEREPWRMAVISGYPRPQRLSPAEPGTTGPQSINAIDDLCDRGAHPVLRPRQNRRNSGSAGPNGYGVRTLVHEVVQSDLFLNK